MSYPMLTGGPYFRFTDLAVGWRRLKRKVFRSQGNALSIDISDNNKDRVLEFSEYPACESCGSQLSKDILVAVDGNHVVECEVCGLWYTSPRVKEEDWVAWLKGENERNKQVTENRLKHGVALSRNIPLAFSFWWRLVRFRYHKKLKQLIDMHGGQVNRLFDVGCGCGFLLKAAEDLGISASGNDLNSYAVNRMKEVLGLDVNWGQLPKLVADGKVKNGIYDLIYMNDFIEHSYHPKQDFEAAYKISQQNGLIYVRTFCIDSDKYKKLGSRWDMLMWNHCFHFTSKSLTAMIESVGFSVSSCDVDKGRGIVEVVARKID
jgi:2-polyprenyl-3-methyl-5-hydroxy-6-metoxy-1,4-benzoquinol methylase